MFDIMDDHVFSEKQPKDEGDNVAFVSKFIHMDVEVNASQRNKDVVLKHFDMSVFSDTRHTYKSMIIGRRDTGKTHLITEILNHQPTLKANTTIVYSTKEEGERYSNHFRGAMLHDNFEYSLIEDAIKRINKTIKMERDEYQRGQIEPSQYTIVLDNCLYEHDFYKNKEIRLLFMNGNVFRINTIISLNYPNGIPPNLRVNLDYTFIFYDPDFSYRKRIWEKYVYEFLSLEKFNDIMAQLTNPYECLVVKNSESRSKNLDDILSVILYPKVDVVSR
jgi:hypothetical protein